MMSRKLCIQKLGKGTSGGLAVEHLMLVGLGPYVGTYYRVLVIEKRLSHLVSG